MNNRVEYFDIEQGSEQWLQMKIGVFSSSEIFHLFTEPKTKKDKDDGVLSQSAKSYIEGKAEEIIYNEPSSLPDMDALLWGQECEPLAAEAYAHITKQELFEIGFVTLGEDTGTSPDRYVGNDGLLEIKCPHKKLKHIKNIMYLNSPKDLLKHYKQYYYQCQHQMYITGRKWCDFVSFDKRILDTECDWNKCIKILRIPFDETLPFESKIKKAVEYRNHIVKSML